MWFNSHQHHNLTSHPSLIYEHSRQQLPKNININIITSIRTVPSTSTRTAPSTSGTNSRSLVSWNPISRATSSRVPPSAPGWASHPPSWRGPSGALFWECLETSLDGRRETRNRNSRGWEPGNLEFPAFIPQQRKLMGIAPVCTGAGAGSGSTKFRRRFRRFRRRSGRLRCRARSGSTGFRKRFWRRPGRLWCRARSGSTGFRRRFRRRFQEALVQSQVRFNRIPEKFPEEVGEALVQSQVKFNRVPEKVMEKV